MTERRSKLNDPDMQNSAAALTRAAKQARKIAKQTGTRIVIMRDGQLVRETPLDDDENTPANEQST